MNVLTAVNCYFCNQKIGDDVFPFTDPDHDRLCKEQGGAPMYGAHKACAKKHMDVLRIVPRHKIPRLERHIYQNRSKDTTKPVRTDKNKIKSSLDLIWRYGGIPGGHHKQWLLDQLVRTLTGSEEAYNEWVHRVDDDADEYGKWDQGIAP